MAHEDIRSDGRPIPLTHHSARGNVQRNAGNFTRGSQLLTHELLMWISGARLPVILWFFLFVAAWLIIMSIKLDEHGFQLVCMKIYSAFWGWVDLDPAKRVNVTLPTGEIERTVMQAVPYIPEVIRAWDTATRGLLGAFLISIFIAIPTAIWFIDLSHRRGRSILQERHERGAMLVDRALLRAEILEHNQARYEEDVHAHCPGHSPAAVLAMPFRARKEAGIHHPYLLAGIPFPHRTEQSHVMLIGTTGSGKTTELRSLVAQMTLPRTRSLRTWFMFDELGALHRLPAIENGLQTGRAFGGAMVLGIHSFEKLVEVYGEQGARNLASLARTKLILATADLDTAEQCARYIGNREVRQMDEAYSYGYNNTRDASTLTPRKQLEPLVIADDITNLPALHGFVKFPDGFPAARILLEWKDYPAVAEGHVARADVSPVRSKRAEEAFGQEEDGEAGGRDGASQVSEGEAEPRNVARDLAARILSVEPEPSEETAPREAPTTGAPGGAPAPASEAPARYAGQPSAEAEAPAPSRDPGAKGQVATPPVPEDLTLFELRQAFGNGREDDGLDIGI